MVLDVQGILAEVLDEHLILLFVVGLSKLEHHVLVGTGFLRLGLFLLYAREMFLRALFRPEEFCGDVIVTVWDLFRQELVCVVKVWVLLLIMSLAGDHSWLVLHGTGGAFS